LKIKASPSGTNQREWVGSPKKNRERENLREKKKSKTTERIGQERLESGKRLGGFFEKKPTREHGPPAARG